MSLQYEFVLMRCASVPKSSHFFSQNLDLNLRKVRILIYTEYSEKKKVRTHFTMSLIVFSTSFFPVPVPIKSLYRPGMVHILHQGVHFLSQVSAKFSSAQERVGVLQQSLTKEQLAPSWMWLRGRGPSTSAAWMKEEAAFHVPRLTSLCGPARESPAAGREELRNENVSARATGVMFRIKLRRARANATACGRLIQPHADTCLFVSICPCPLFTHHKHTFLLSNHSQHLLNPAGSSRWLRNITLV